MTENDNATNRTETTQPAAGPAPKDGISHHGGSYSSHRPSAHFVYSDSSAVKDEEIEKRKIRAEIIKCCMEHIIKILIPVSVCMLVVVGTVSSVEFYTVNDVYKPFRQTSVQLLNRVLNTATNSMVMISVVITMPFYFIVAYKYHCFKLIQGWRIIMSLLFLSAFVWLYIQQILHTFNIPMDMITLCLSMWNVCVLGLACIHWKGPLLLQQSYLIFTAALVAIVFIKYIPDWTTWVVLFVISVWDIIAVLTPLGPLRIMVELADKYNKEIFPSLLYSSTVVYNTMKHQTGVDNTTGSMEMTRTLVKEDQQLPPERVQHYTNVKLELSDFILYSVLVGKVSSYGDWNTTLACFLAILIGLCITITLLTVHKQALPALPISIAFGLIFYFATQQLVKPFLDLLASKQIFI